MQIVRSSYALLRALQVGAFALLLTVGLIATTPLSVANGEEYTIHSFKKIKITDEFFSEGMFHGDFNHDGKTDVVAGIYWYEGPEFTERHLFRAGKAFDPHGYSNAFLMFAHDFNSDEWDDVLVIGFPGKEAFWYENPKSLDGEWKQHLASPVVDNESPGFGDVTGDGQPELLFHTNGFLGYAEFDAKNPNAEWTFHKISDKGSWGRYQHGFGVGDVNGDGRSDFMLREGWWEQPAQANGKPWNFHAANFGGGGAQMFAYDVDGDGDNDVISSLQAHGYGLAWFENKPTAAGEIAFERHLIVGSTPEENPYGVKFSQLHAVDLVDMDGDGTRDIVTGKRYWAHGPKGDAEPAAPAVLYWFQTVRGKDGVEFVPHQIDNDSGVGTQVIAADVTNDGLADVIVGNKKGHFVFVHQTRKVSRDEWLKAQPQKK